MQAVWLVEPPKDVFAGIIIFGVFTLFFFGLGIFGLRIVRNAPGYSIVVDDGGIRYLHARPDVEAVRWVDLIVVRERPGKQRLDLISHQGAVLRVEYQLDQFEDLRAIILSHIEAAPSSLIPFAHKKSIFIHVFYGLFIGLLIVGAYYLISSSPEDKQVLYVGITVLATFVFMHEYLTQVIGIEATDRQVVLKYPFRSVSVDVSKIAAVELKDDFVKQSRIPFVVIKLLSGKSYPIKSAGVDVIQLVAVLEAARGKAAVC